MKKSKHFLLSLVVCALIVPVTYTAVQKLSESKSVEIGLQEMSPKGEAGGFAVPASGASYQGSVNFDLSCADTPGKVNVTATYTGPSAYSVSAAVEGTYKKVPFTTQVDDISGPNGAFKVDTDIKYTSCYSAMDCVEEVTHGVVANISCSKPTECNDGIDNDGDGTIDYNGIPDLPPTYDFSTDHPYINYSPSQGGNQTDTAVAGKELAGLPQRNGANFYHFDIGKATTDHICDLFGYQNSDRGGTSYSISSCSNDFLYKWDGSVWTISSACASPRHVNRLTCSNLEVPGGAPKDPQCTGPDDDSEGGIGVNLRVRKEGGGWTDGPLDIASGDQINLTWNSASAAVCIGSKFSTGTGQPTSGVQTNVTEPIGNTSEVYAVICSDGNGQSGRDSVVVNNTSSYSVDLTADPIYVHKGESTNLTWDLDGLGANSCTLTGSSELPPDPLSKSQPLSVPIYGETTFKLDCGDGSDTVTVHVLPTVQET